MAIRIKEILERVNNYSIATLSHGKEELTAKVWDEFDSLKKRIGKEDIIVELNYDKLIALRTINDFDDFNSAITNCNGNYIIKGRVSNFIETENDTLIDIYLQTGPEFICILKSEIGNIKIEEGQGVEIEVTDLKFFPTKN